MTHTLIYIICAIIIIFIAYKVITHSIVENKVKREINRIMPYWAAQRPFKNGTESANAMKGALYALYGKDGLEERMSFVQNHKEAYDQDATGWEPVIKAALSSDRVIDKQTLRLAKTYTKMQQMNDDFLLDKGYRAEVARDEQGNDCMVVRNLETNETEEYHSNDSDTVDTSIDKLGKWIHGSQLEEGKELLAFLTYWHNLAREEDDKKDPLPADEVGRIYKVFLDYIDEGVEDNPDMEVVVQQFSDLREAYLRAEDEKIDPGISQEDYDEANTDDLIRLGSILFDFKTEEGARLLALITDLAKGAFPEEPITQYKIGFMLRRLLDLKDGSDITHEGALKEIEKFKALFEAYKNSSDCPADWKVR